jgi:hypothetical protein
LTKLQGPDILKLLIAVDEINIQTLINYIQEYLIKQQNEFLQENPIEMLEMVYQHETFTELLNFYLEKICAEPGMLLDSDKFIILKEPVLELLLKRDDLLLDEIVVWDNLIKWCLVQHPNISQDVTQWNKEEVTTMERAVHRFIPLIRFYHIISEDFVFKVYPFKKLIPKDLINNLLVFHLAPNKHLNIDIKPPRRNSIIIENQHFAIFTSWIDNNADIKNIPYYFNLLYRASRDGNTAAEFHAKCDNKGATIAVAKIKDSEQIVGGYNPLFWDSSDSYKSTNGSFIFSFTDRTNLQTAKVGYCNENQYSAYCYQYYGPSFGRGHDIYSQNDIWYINNPYSYFSIDINNINKNVRSGYINLKVEDYEVFQVIKR